jgi:hypothetical protein
VQRENETTGAAMQVRILSRNLEHFQEKLFGERIAPPVTKKHETSKALGKSSRRSVE